MKSKYLERKNEIKADMKYLKKELKKINPSTPSLLGYLGLTFFGFYHKNSPLDNGLEIRVNRIKERLSILNQELKKINGIMTGSYRDSDNLFIRNNESDKEGKKTNLSR